MCCKNSVFYHSRNPHYHPHAPCLGILLPPRCGFPQAFSCLAIPSPPTCAGGKTSPRPKTPIQGHVKPLRRTTDSMNRSNSDLFDRIFCTFTAPAAAYRPLPLGLRKPASPSRCATPARLGRARDPSSAAPSACRRGDARRGPPAPGPAQAAASTGHEHRPAAHSVAACLPACRPWSARRRPPAAWPGG
jgi:hypothetical protein